MEEVETAPRATSRTPVSDSRAPRPVCPLAPASLLRSCAPSTSARRGAAMPTHHVIVDVEVDVSGGGPLGVEHVAASDNAGLPGLVLERQQRGAHSVLVQLQQRRQLGQAVGVCDPGRKNLLVWNEYAASLTRTGGGGKLFIAVASQSGHSLAGATRIWCGSGCNLMVVYSFRKDRIVGSTAWCLTCPPPPAARRRRHQSARPWLVSPKKPETRVERCGVHVHQSMLFGAGRSSCAGRQKAPLGSWWAVPDTPSNRGAL